VKAFSCEVELLEFQESEEAKLNALPDNVESFNWGNFLVRSLQQVVAL